jgi:hypothetical protein
LEYSEDSYYFMDMILEDTGYEQPPEWTTRDPYRRHDLDAIPRIAVDHSRVDEYELSRENITLGSTVTVKSTHPVMVFINYNKDDWNFPSGVDLIPGLTPPTKRGLPEIPTIIVAFAGIVLIADVVATAMGRRSIVEVF